MSAERLRAAAMLLRERAEGATPGPWRWEPPSGESWPQADQSLVQAFVPEGNTYPESVLDGWGYDACGINGRDEDRAYIALMSPPVALALADWLDEVATRAYDYPKQYRGSSRARAIADAILGDQP